MNCIANKRVHFFFGITIKNLGGSSIVLDCQEVKKREM